MNDHRSRVMPGRADIQGLQLLESCSFHWIFDGATRRFRRTPRDAAVRSESAEAWTEYHHLQIDDARSCFAVGLDENRAQVLRAWLHTDPCHHCGRDVRSTGEHLGGIPGWKTRFRVHDRFALNGAGKRHPLRPFGGWGPQGSGPIAVQHRWGGRGEE
jgi:hypothetical protein